MPVLHVDMTYTAFEQLFIQETYILVMPELLGLADRRLILLTFHSLPLFFTVWTVVQQA